MHKGNWSLIGFVILLTLATLACDVPGFSEKGPGPTPTAVGDTMFFNIPAYTYQLSPGASIPGSALQFVDRNGDAYEVRVDGQTHFKRTGDSFFWRGVIAPGVFGTFNLRLTTSVFGAMPVAGSVEVMVLNPESVEVSTVPITENTLSFSNVLIDYPVPLGYTVPGTSLTFERVEERGAGGEMVKFARLSDFSGNSYFDLARGDSLVWMGKLHDNFYVRYNLRAIDLDDDEIRLSGTAELWVIPKS